LLTRFAKIFKKSYEIRTGKTSAQRQATDIDFADFTMMELDEALAHFVALTQVGVCHFPFHKAREGGNMSSGDVHGNPLRLRVTYSGFVLSVINNGQAGLAFMGENQLATWTKTLGSDSF